MGTASRNGSVPTPNLARGGVGVPGACTGAGTRAAADHQYGGGLPFGGSWPRHFQGQHAAACPRTQSLAAAALRKRLDAILCSRGWPGWHVAAAGRGVMACGVHAACPPAAAAAAAAAAALCCDCRARGPLAWDSGA